MKMRMSDGDYEKAIISPQNPSLLLLSWDEEDDDPSLCPILSKHKSCFCGF